MLRKLPARTAWIAIAAAALAAGCSSFSGGSLPDNHAGAAQIGARTGTDATTKQFVVATIEKAVGALPKPTPPGIAVAVYYQGEAYYFYRGVRSLRGKPVDGNTIFELGSLTKSFTGIMLGAAVNQKTAGVTLTDHPAPWVAFVGNPNAVAPQPVQTSCVMPTATPLPPARYGTVKEMTLLELGTHTSGIPYTPPPPDGYELQRQCYSPQQLVNYIEGGHFHKPPAPWVYSNIGFGFLGYVEQGISKKATHKAVDWYDLAQSQIIHPLGMTHTYDLNVPKSMLDEYVQPYSFTNGKAVPALHWTWDPYPAAGVLRSTALDMMSYLKLALRVQGPPAMIAAAATAEKEYTKDNYGDGQGLAWQYEPLYGANSKNPPPPQEIWKDGGTAGCTTWIGLILGSANKQPMGIVVLTNGNDIPVNPLVQAILTPLYFRT
jgi:serine-type D-Ala-D-Ala carboxypeptidase/endopeptidase